ncbi:MAG: hypothetical protein GY715_03775 [Planctomycetes bacterium]|nr:hypothetical protein [Planctomycetota bacterium]
MPPIIALLALTLAGPPDIVIDGSFADWHDVSVATADGVDAPGAELDFGEVRVVSDGRFLHVLAYLGAEVNVQRLDGRGLILVDGDGDGNTGSTRHGMPGVDAVVILTPPSTDGRRPGMGVGVEVPGADGADGNVALSPYELGVTFGPTYANRTVEFRIDRAPDVAALAGFLGGRRCALKLVLLSPDGALADETDVVTHTLPPLQTAADRGGPSDALAPREAGHIRVMSWNTRYGALVKNPHVAGDIVAALDPDILLLQEMSNRDSAKAIARVLDDASPDSGERPWRVIFGSGGGNLRCAIAARHPVERAPLVEPIAYPHQPGRFMRTAGAVVRIGDMDILAVSTHLKCCGRIGDKSDGKREREAAAIRAAVLAAYTARADGQRAIDAIVIGGDLNLVGGRRPLEILREGIDVNGSDLAIAGPVQPDGRSNATWMDTGQPFVAGRLDYLLYSDARLRAVRSFILDTHDVDAATLGRYGLERADTRGVSDHLPVVLDLEPRRPGS